MNKSELIDAIAHEADCPRATAERAVNAFTDVVGKTLATGEEVSLVGFGTFKTSERAARTGRNPQSGETIQIKAATVPAFKAGKALKELVNTKAK